MSSPFGDDAYVGYDGRLPSQRYECYPNFVNDDSAETVVVSDDHQSPGFYAGVDGILGRDGCVEVHHVSSDGSVPPSPEGFGHSSDLVADFSSEVSPFAIPNSSGKVYWEEENGVYFASDDPILPPPRAMHPEEGFVPREWRRKNAIYVAEKEMKEKEMWNQIVSEAEQYLIEFYKERQLNRETNKITNREKEKVLNIEKKKGKKDDDKKPSIVVVQGPKPGKPTDLSRLLQLLTKLKHCPPPYVKPPSPTPAVEPTASFAIETSAETLVS
ncbi:hypothetical protein HPP92_020812 [Vanilla planifolia]|uniref:Clathrin light chain n=1 Tax=Vanilla planifolia TaxID=51239 RepID=A0A835PXN3_VANPL|nr:hypothetical protein HPP92_020812 [Vanilla planifolia]